MKSSLIFVSFFLVTFFKIYSQSSVAQGALNMNVIENVSDDLVRSVELNWTSSGTSNTQVYLVSDSDREVFIARDSSDGKIMLSPKKWNAKAFRLYASTSDEMSGKGELLDEVSLPSGKLSISNIHFEDGEEFGSVTVSWAAERTPNVYVWVQVGDGEPQLMDCDGPVSSQSVDWIKKGDVYTFKLYAADECIPFGVNTGHLLDKVTIPSGKIEAAMYAIPVQNNNIGTAHLNWSIKGYPIAQVWVEEPGKTPKVFAGTGMSGTGVANLITKGSEYTFKLYACTDFNPSGRAVLVDQVTVKGIPSITKMIGVNKFNLLYQYYGNASGIPNISGKKELYRRMAKKAIADAKDLGFGYMRVSMSFINGEQIGLWKNDRIAYKEAVEAMLADLNELDMKLIPTLSWAPFQFALYTHEDSAIEDESAFEEFINPNSESKKILAEFIADIVGTYKSNPAILFWELSNEANLDFDKPHSNDYPAKLITTAVWKEHMKWMCEKIREFDLDHMISSGNQTVSKNAYHWFHNDTWGEDDENQFEEMLLEQNKYCDIVSAHIYKFRSSNEWAEDRFDYSSGDFSYIADMNDYVENMNKLLYLGEIGDWSEFGYEHSAPATQQVLEIVSEKGIPFSSPWVWEHHEFSTWGDEAHNIDPSCPESKYLIDKMIEVNAELGNDSWTKEQDDVTPPRVVITYPLSNDEHIIDTIIARLEDGKHDNYIGVEASDNNRIIDRVEVYINNEMVEMDSDNFPYSYHYNYNVMELSSHKVEAFAYDEAGNVSSDCMMLINKTNRLHSPNVVHDESSQSNIITWFDCDYETTIYKVIRYDCYNGEESWILIGYVNGRDFIVDDSLDPRKTYTYSVCKVEEGVDYANSLYSGVSGMKSYKQGTVVEKEDVLPVIYPNPASDIIKINNVGDYTKLIISNELGVEVYKSSISEDITIDISNYNKGVYFIHLISDGKNFTEKFIIE